MKVLRFGNPCSRYALIVMMKNIHTHRCVDDTITYYNSSLKNEIKGMYDKLVSQNIEHQEKRDGIYLDISVFNYEDMKYCTKEFDR